MRNILTTFFYVLTREQKSVPSEATKTAFEPVLKSMNTASSLSKTILEILSKWRNKRSIVAVSYPTIFEIRQAIKE